MILAGLLLVGWPLALYYGFLRPKPEEARPAPIAALPPLPPPDEAPELASLVDVSPTSLKDQGAKSLLLDRVRSTPPSDLAKKARREVLPISILKNPKRYRGLPIHFDGYAAEVFAVDDIDPELTPKGRLYEIWIRTLDHDQRTYPVCLIVEDVPPTLPGGKNLEARIAFDGYFLKLVSYKAVDEMRFAPVLIGRLTHLVQQSKVPARSPSYLWTALPLGLLAVYVTARIFFAQRKIRRNLQNQGTRMIASGREDRIEPEALENWLRLESTEEPGHEKPSR